MAAAMIMVARAPRSRPTARRLGELGTALVTESGEAAGSAMPGGRRMWLTERCVSRIVIGKAMAIVTSQKRGMAPATHRSQSVAKQAESSQLPMRLGGSSDTRGLRQMHYRQMPRK